MNPAKLSLSLFLLLAPTILVACASGPSTTPTAPLPPTRSNVPTFQPPNVPTPTPTPVPSATPVVATPTITPLPEQPVAGVDELVGVWSITWSDQTTLFVEFTPLRRAVITFPEGDLVGRDTFSIENGRLTWESVDTSLDVSTACAANPVATYEVYLTRQGDQPVSLRFVLVGQDACLERSLLLTTQQLRWVGP